jgi:uroporphyrinogen decarboxylase
MNVKKEIINGIKNKQADRAIPMMYRANMDTDIKMHKYFGLDEPEKDWKNLLKALGADIMTNGDTLSRWFTYIPEYKESGPYNNLYHDPVLYYSWGLDSKPVSTGTFEYVNFAINEPLRNAGIDEIIKYRGPEIDDFNFDNFNYDPAEREDNFFCTTVLNYIYMLSKWLRGEEQFLMDLAANQKLAGVLVDKVGEFAVMITGELYKRHGKKLDMYGIFDDVATQDAMIMNPDIWRKFFKKWFKKLIEEVKKYDQIVLFHCCGNPNAIIPDFIEMGVDILDPVQTSARDMGLERLKKEYGKDICFHGGIDVQKLLPYGTAREIKDEVKKIKNIFRDDGFIILGPSHQMEIDIPVENIVAMYQ